MSASDFQKAYKELNKNQKVAVDTLDGPVMVLAGPGTGKTQVLTLRIANILQKTDTQPNSILALTFTEAAAREMRERLVNLIGTPGYFVRIHTFHGFCQSVITENPDLFPGFQDQSLLTDLDRVRLLEKLITEIEIEVMRPLNAPFYYLNAIQSSIRDLKREGVLVKDFQKIVRNLDESTKERELKKLQELSLIYKEYQAELLKENRLDFEDLINMVTQKLEDDKTLRLGYQEKLAYFLVDEYQDTNSAQNKLIFTLTSFWKDKANLFTVGDPNQCLPGSTMITTKGGPKKIKDMKVGDIVLSAVGKGYTSYVKITKVFRQKKKAKQITFITSSGKKVTVTDNHKMFCYIPPRKVSNYWYNYLMYKDGVGWRLGITKSLSIRLKTESGADKIVGIACHDTESEARYFETIYSLKYQIPTIVFNPRGGEIDSKYIDKVFSYFDTFASANRLAKDLGINLHEPHYIRDATTLGKGRTKINFMMCSRSYKSAYSKDGLLDHPEVLHQINIQTSNAIVLKKLRDMGFRLRNKNIGKGFRLSSVNIKSLYQVAEKLEKDLPGFLDIKSPIGTVEIQHRSSRVMQAGNVLVGNYLPVLHGYRIKYEEIVSRTEKFKEEDVYDLEVTPSHNFIANGIVVHNSIYRFQGASTENLQEFIHRFPKATLINLIDNYRSVQNILDSAHHLIKHNPPFPLLPSFNLKSNLPDIKNTITIINAPDDLTENQSLIQELERKHTSGIAWKEMAILGRNNRELLDLSSQLLKEKIPVRIEGGENILDNPLINHFLSLLRAINNGVGESDDLNLFTLLHYFFWKLNPSTILKLARLASDSHQTLYSYIIKNQNESPEISKVVDQITHFQALEANHTFPEFFERVFQESGLSEYILTQDNPGISLSQFQDLFHFTQALAKKNDNYHLADFIKDLDTLVRQSIKLPSSEPILQTDAVTLTTAHKSKGLEWDTVFIYRFTDRTWGNKIDRNLLRLPAQVLEFASVDTDPNAEDRRLFYVALTRAKRNLLITYANPALPSLFLSELPEDLVNKIILEPTEKEYQKFQISSLSPVPTLKDDEKEYLRELLADFKLSVTALNTYLDCGYKFKLNNLYRLPRAKDAHLSFGTAVHGALEKFHRTLRDKKVTPPKEYLLQFFSQSLDREIFTPVERSRRRKHGELILSSYYDYYFDQFTPAIATEMALGRGSSVCLLEDIQLTGNIDRVDLIDPNTKEVKVVDYKTGRAQTRNEIEGKTKNATMHYKRQLVFYRLLGDLANNFPYIVKEAELDFIEPDNGKFRKEKFEITAEEVKELKQLIKETMKKIRALEFNRTTDTSLCQSCEFLSHCFPNGI